MKDLRNIQFTYLIFSSKLGLTMCKMATISLNTVLVLRKMLTQRCLIKVVKLLTTLLLLGRHDGNWYVLGLGRVHWLQSSHRRSSGLKSLLLCLFTIETKV